MKPPLNRADTLLGLFTLLLLALAGGWAVEALPSRPLPKPPAAPESARPKSATPVNGQVTPADTAAALAAADAEPTPQTPVDTTIRFAASDPLEGDTMARPCMYRRYLGTLNGRAIVVHLSVRADS